MPPDRAKKPRPIVILGPTAGGKSDLAVRLAEAAPGGGQVVGADSMQVYRHLDAGTAKPTAGLRERVPHHLIDIVEPDERFTVHDWLVRADAVIAAIQTAGGTPIVVGGTNLYLKALLEGLFDGPGRDEAWRATLAEVPGERLHARLASIDPDAASRIAPADRQRITRALEVHHLTGRPISALQRQWDDAPPAAYRHDARLIGLRWSVEAINHRINRRVKAMFFPEKVEPELAATVCINGESLPDEVRRLVDEQRLGRDATAQANEAIGYKQCLAALRGSMSREDAFEKTKIATRRFAKQQRTWLKRFARVTWLDAEGGIDDATIDRILKTV
ncbi:MAG: tRNA (adenosine(37)-N6)-dimethylallyltransferase MiaA [Planctomycetes bacterium]|nr:tRNA (adenosine(37)-N6)-dimethylallyltransferase MiaA [Planctomycetota bacterium]